MVAAVVQLVRISACHVGGHGFEPRSPRHFFRFFDHFAGLTLSSRGPRTSHSLCGNASSNLARVARFSFLNLFCLVSSVGRADHS